MIHQGRRYTYEGQPVLAMEDAERLVPAPMKYHQGAVPAPNVGIEARR